MDTSTRTRSRARRDVNPGPWTAALRARCPVHRDTVRRLVRYSTVSLISTSTSLVTLGVLVGLAGTPATWANVMATAVGTVPSFELNRRWVWNSTRRRSVVGQVVPFCALSFTGLVVSTLAVGVVAARTSGWGRWDHTAAVLLANVASYGALWVVQYLLLDRVLFAQRTRAVGRGASLGSGAVTDLSGSGGFDHAAAAQQVPGAGRSQHDSRRPFHEQRGMGVGGTEAVPEPEQTDLH